MKTTTIAKLLDIMPAKLVTFMSKKVVDNYLKKYANINISGKENLDQIKTPVIFICNHLSNSDGLVLNKALKQVDPTFLAGVKLSDNSITNIGLNVVKTTNIKPNSADKEGIKKVIKLVKQGESLLIFPEGTRSRVGSMIEAKKGIVLIARLTKVPLVPIGISGTEKLLPIHSDGDMSKEMFKHADVQITIGKQFNLLEKTKDIDKKEYEEIATNDMMVKIAELLPEHYKGVYK